MTDPSAKNTQVSWQTTQGFSVFLVYILRPDIESVIILICLTVMLVCMGISPLSIENKPVSVLIAAMLMIALGGGIGGLTIGTLLERLVAETHIEIGGSWVASVALICTSLGILAWTLIVLRISPVTRPPLVAAILFAIAGVYALIRYPNIRDIFFRNNSDNISIQRRDRIYFKWRRDPWMDAPRYTENAHY